MRYLVTGSAGFIGSHLLETLRAEGHDVVGADCFTDYYDVALKEENARGQEILRLDLACEHLPRAPANSFGLDVVVAQYFNAYGPRQRPDMAFTRIAMCLAEGRAFDLFSDGLQSRSFTYVADVVRGTMRAMESGSGTY